VHGHDRLLHLEEEWVRIPVAKAQRQIGAGTDAPYADHPVGHVGDRIPAQHVPIGRREMLGVLGKRCDDLAVRGIVHTRENGRVIPEPPAPVGAAVGDLRQQGLIRRPLCLAHRLLNDRPRLVGHFNGRWPTFPATTMVTELGRFFGGVQSACAVWGTLLSICAPAARRIAGFSRGRSGSYRLVTCQDSRLDVSLAIKACCVASSTGSAGEGRGDFFAAEPRTCVFEVMFCPNMRN
jgi:hypothetical protein